MLLDQNQNPNVVNIFKKKTEIWQSFLAKTGILQHNIYFLFFILAKKIKIGSKFHSPSN
jgi:hypothetical protein